MINTVSDAKRVMIYKRMIRNFEQWRKEAPDEQSRNIWTERIEKHQQWIDEIERGESA